MALAQKPTIAGCPDWWAKPTLQRHLHAPIYRRASCASAGAGAWGELHPLGPDAK